MRPWEFKMGQVVGYRPRGEKWRARVTAIDRDGKPFLAEIPIVDEGGEAIRYEDPPGCVNAIIDYEQYYLVKDVNGSATDPWLAARLDHEDTGTAWKAFAAKVGVKEPYYQALSTLLEKWVPEGARGEFLDDILVLLHASWRAGMAADNADCVRLLQKRCDEKGAICLAHCSHPEDIKALKILLRGNM